MTYHKPVEVGVKFLYIPPFSKQLAKRTWSAKIDRADDFLYQLTFDTWYTLVNYRLLHNFFQNLLKSSYFSNQNSLGSKRTLSTHAYFLKAETSWEGKFNLKGLMALSLLRTIALWETKTNKLISLKARKMEVETKIFKCFVTSQSERKI